MNIEVLIANQWCRWLWFSPLLTIHPQIAVGAEASWVWRLCAHAVDGHSAGSSLPTGTAIPAVTPELKTRSAEKLKRFSVKDEDLTSETALIQGSNCGEAYDRLSMETFQHLEYLLAWLEARTGTPEAASFKNIKAGALAERQRLLDGLLPALEPRTAILPKAEPVLEMISLSPSAEHKLVLLLATKALIPGGLDKIVLAVSCVQLNILIQCICHAALS